MRRRRARWRSSSYYGLGAGALTQHSVLRGSMNSERPPESASSTPTGPRGSEGLREGLGYFLFEFWRPFKHVTCVPRARPQQGQHASPAGRSHRRPRRRQGGKGWQGRRQGRWQGWWPWRTRPALRRRPQRPILDQSRRSDGGRVAAARLAPWRSQSAFWSGSKGAALRECCCARRRVRWRRRRHPDRGVIFLCVLLWLGATAVT